MISEIIFIVTIGKCYWYWYIIFQLPTVEDGYGWSGVWLC